MFDTKAPAGAHPPDASTAHGETPSKPLAVTTTKDMVSAVAAQAKGVASDVAHHAQELVTAKITNQQTKSASDIAELARALRNTGKQLDGNMMSPYMGKAADQMERLSRFIRTTNVDELKGTAESFARREPALFLGGALILGILGARFLKSSSRHEASGSMQANGGPGRAAVSSDATRSSGVRRPAAAAFIGAGRP